jgi:hypothetical protein
VLPLYEGNGCNGQQGKVYCFRLGYAPIFIKNHQLHNVCCRENIKNSIVKLANIGGAHQINYAPVLGL